MSNTITLRIHHFFDIIRDYGNDTVLSPHPYGHSLHKIYNTVIKNPNQKIKIVMSNDSICEGCIKATKGGHCTDEITHRKDFTMKEDFNNHIDSRIIEVCEILEGQILTPRELCKKADNYINNMEHIYEGNDTWHTRERKRSVKRGIKKYS